MRSGMMIGAENGRSATSCAPCALPGFVMIGPMKITDDTSSSITGVAACCTSSWLFTIAPTAANSDA